MGGLDKKGGTAKPLRDRKKAQKEEDEDDIKYKQAQKERAKAEKDMAAQLSGKKGPLNTGSQGIKKSGKK